MAVWDNRSTAHVAPTDVYETDFNRQLYRVTLVGAPLVGYHTGQPSKLLEGSPILSVEEELAAIENFNAEELYRGAKPSL